MPALVAGKNAPRFTLPLVQGGSFSLDDALARGPVLLAFFKISCPVCQFAMPYVERLYKAYGQSGVSIVGVSQDDASATTKFMKEFGVSMPIALEDTRSWNTSNEYGLTNVPSLFFSTNLHSDYHTPRDEPKNINFPKLTRMTEWMYMTGWIVGNAAKRPALDEGFVLR